MNRRDFIGKGFSGMAAMSGVAVSVEEALAAVDRAVRLKPGERRSAGRLDSDGTPPAAGWHAGIKTAKSVIDNRLHGCLLMTPSRPKWKSCIKTVGRITMLAAQQ
jgi:hypothetical protein